MATFNDDSVAINLNILKQCGFYQIFDPNSKKIFGWNVYLLSFITFNAIFQCIQIFGNCGFFFGVDDTINTIALFLIMSANSYNYIYVWKVFILVFHRNKILDLLDVTNVYFLKSKPCRNNIKILYNHRNRALQITRLYLYAIIVVIIQWGLFPVMINSFNKNENQRLESVFNMRYPLKVNTYNQYYILIYILEEIISIQSTYLLYIIDILLFSIGWAIITQYEVLAIAFKNIGHRVNIQNDNSYYVEEDYIYFKSVLFDQQRLDLKLKLYFTIMKPIVLMYVALNSALIIVLSNTFIMTFLSTEPITYTIINLIKFGSAILLVTLQLFLYCHLFDNINSKIESVNFGIYSCNWTMMDLKLKKLILLTMRMNDANQITMRATTKKIVNLQLFSSILMTSYNIVSVMVKTIRK